MRRQHLTRNYNLTGLNVSAACIPQQSNSFSLTASPRTDLWRPSAAADNLQAPILFTTLRFPFVSAEVTVSAPWNLEWDQAGLVLFIGDPAAAPTQQQSLADSHLDSFSTLLEQPPAYSQTSLRWVKLGLEVNEDVNCVASAIATAHGTDWSSTTLEPPLSFRGELRVKMERVGQSLWLLYEGDAQQQQQQQQQQAAHELGGKRWRKVRQVTGFFTGVEDKAVRVGVYASRPAGLHASNALNAERDLTVDFEDLVIF